MIPVGIFIGLAVLCALYAFGSRLPDPQAVPVENDDEIHGGHV